MPSLESLNLSIAILTLNICGVSSATWWNSVPNLSEIELSTVVLLRSDYLILWPCTCVTCSTMLCTQFKLGQPISSWNCTIFLTLIRYVTLRPWPLTLKICGTWCVTRSKLVRNMSEIEQSPTDLFIIFGNFCHVTSRCDLYPLTLNFCGTSGMMCPNTV